jgi:3-oxoacyl-[acyl-carrier protein] reductase
VVNNAAISQFRLFTDITEEEWRRMLDIKPDGRIPLHAGGIAPDDLPQGRGHRQHRLHVWASWAPPAKRINSATKGAVIALTKAWQRKSAPAASCVNCVSPGVS